jgi:hypothetical protein
VIWNAEDHGQRSPGRALYTRNDRRSLAAPPQLPPRESPRREVWVVLGLALSFVVAYVLGAAPLLRSHLESSAERAGLALDIGSARSSWPGQFHFKDVELVAPGGTPSLRAARVDTRQRWRTLGSDPPALGEVHASGVQLRWADRELGPLMVELRRRGDSSGWLVIDGPRTAMQWPGRTIELSLRADVELRHLAAGERGPIRIELGDGVIEATDIRVSQTPRPPQPPPNDGGADRWNVTLRAEGGSIALDGTQGFTLAGGAHATGGDSAAALQRWGIDDNLRWLIADLDGQPFVMKSWVRVCEQGAEIHTIRFQSGIVTATGALRAYGGGWRGALLLRRGSLAVGLELLEDGVAALLSPEPLWLAGARARLRDVCAGAVR